MVIDLGMHENQECVLDLRGLDLYLRLPHGEGEKDRCLLKVNGLSWGRGVHRNVKPEGEAPTYNVYTLLPAIAPRVDGGVYYWEWTANYYWAPPKSSRAKKHPGVQVRSAVIALARVAHDDFRLEVSLFNQPKQLLILDEQLSERLEDHLKNREES